MEKGTEVTFNGEILYHQDFTLWKNDFGNKIFTFVKELNNGLLAFEAKGYGIISDYGNGRIYVNKKYLKK